LHNIHNRLGARVCFMKLLCLIALGWGAAATAGATAAPAPAAAEREARAGAPAAAAPALAALEAQLRIALAPTAAVIVGGADSLELRFPARQAFAPDTAELLPSGRAMLDLLARSLRDFGGTQVVVAVYTDAIGSEEFNRQQARTRAVALVAYLESRGVAPARLIARGVGKSAPLEAPNTPEGRDLNRRVVFTITPLSS
jgi:outer membrane protein OmpA-like peptidoglycan-associated protein